MLNTKKIANTEERCLFVHGPIFVVTAGFFCTQGPNPRPLQNGHQLDQLLQNRSFLNKKKRFIFTFIQNFDPFHLILFLWHSNSNSNVVGSSLSEEPQRQISIRCPSSKSRNVFQEQKFASYKKLYSKNPIKKIYRMILV